MAYNDPLLPSISAIPIQNVAVAPRTSRPEQQYDLMRQQQAQQATAARPQARTSALAYNPSTQEYALGETVLGKLGLAGIEQAAQEAAKAYGWEGKRPPGFTPINHDRLLVDLNNARANPEADLSGFFQNAQQAAGGIVSAVGALAGDNSIENPFKDVVEDAKRKQKFSEQASYDESPFTSTAGLGTNLATAGGQVLPTIIAGMLTGGAGALAVGATSAGGQQADSGMETLRQSIAEIPEEELRISSPTYDALRDSGKTHDEAVESMLTTARRRGLGVGAIEGTLSAILGTKLLGTVFSKFASKVPGLGAFKRAAESGIAKRTLTASAIGGAAEGGGAAVGDYAVNALARDVAGLDPNYGLSDAWQSFSQEAPLGFVGGAIAGVARGGPKASIEGSDINAAAQNLGRKVPEPPADAASLFPPTGIIPRPDPGFTMGAGTGPRYTGPLPGDGPIDAEFTDVTPGIQPQLPPGAPVAPQLALPAPPTLALPDESQTIPLQDGNVPAPPIGEMAPLPSIAQFMNKVVLPFIATNQGPVEGEVGVVPAESMSAGQARATITKAVEAGAMSAEQSAAANGVLDKILAREAPTEPTFTNPDRLRLIDQSKDIPLPDGDIVTPEPEVVAPAKRGRKGAAVVATAKAKAPAKAPAKVVPLKTKQSATPPVVTTPRPSKAVSTAASDSPATEVAAPPVAAETVATGAKITKGDLLKAKAKALREANDVAKGVALLQKNIRQTVKGRGGKGGALSQRQINKISKEIDIETATPKAPAGIESLRRNVAEKVTEGAFSLRELKQELIDTTDLEEESFFSDALNAKTILDDALDGLAAEDTTPEEAAATIQSVVDSLVARKKTPPAPKGKATVEKVKKTKATPAAEGKKGRPKPRTETVEKSPSSTPKKAPTSTASSRKAASSPRSRPDVGKGEGSTVENLRPIVDKIRQGLGRFAPDIVVVQSLSDVPIETALGASPDTRGLYDRFTHRVYIVADNVSADRVARTIAHEVIGHYGLERILTKDQWQSIKDDIDALRKSDQFRAFFQKLDRDYYLLDDEGKAYEFIARAAELQPESSFIKRIVRMVHSALAKLGLAVSPEVILEDMPSSVRQALRQSAQYLQDGEATSDFEAQGRTAFDTESLREAVSTTSKKAARSGTARAFKQAMLRTWTLRNLENFYGDNKTRFGKAYKRLVGMQFEKAALVNKSLQAMLHTSTKFRALSKAERLNLQETMLRSQEFEINPTLPLKEHTWLGKEPSEQDKKNYDAVVALYNKLGDGVHGGQEVFRGLADHNRKLGADLLKLRIENYRNMRDLPADMRTKEVDRLTNELQGIEKGNINFSMQRKQGDWMLHLPQVFVRVEAYATKPEAAAAAKAITAESPYTKTEIRPEGESFALYTSEPLFESFESEQEAIDAIPGIEAELRAELAKQFKTPEALEEAFNNIWFDESSGIERVTPMARTALYDRLHGEMYTPALLKKLNSLRGKGISEDAYRAMMDDFLSRSDRSAHSKSGIRRRLIRGMKAEDMIEAYIKRFVSGSHALAAETFSFEESGLEAELADRVAKVEYRKATGKDPGLATDQYLKSREATATQMSDTLSNKALQNIRSVVTFLNLGFSPAFMVMNAMQTVVVTVPYLASRTINGHQVTAAEATKAVTDAMGTKELLGKIYESVKDAAIADINGLANKTSTKEQWSDEAIKELKKAATNGMSKADATEFLKVLADLEGQDALTLSYVDSLYDAMNIGGFSEKAQRMQRLAMAGAKLTEVMNRFVTARAAFTLAKKHGMKLEDNEITDFVNETIYKTQGDYSRTNRAELFNTPVGGTILQFKTYVQMMYALLAEGAYKAISGDAAQRKEGRRLLLGLLTSHAAVGGATGLGPVGAAAKLAAVAMFGFGADDDDEHYFFNNMDADTQFRKGMRDLLDDPDGDSQLNAALMHGLPAALLNADLSERIQIPKLWDTRYVRVDRDNNTASWMNGMAAQLLGGAPWGTAVKVVDGSSKAFTGALDGDFRQTMKGITQFMPALIAGPIKAADLATRGSTDSAGRELVSPEDVAFWDAFVTGVGLRTNTVAEAQRKRSDYFDVKNDIEKERADLLKAYNRSKPGPERVRVMKNISAFNARTPSALHVTSRSLAASEKSTNAGDSKRDRAYREMLQ